LPVTSRAIIVYGSNPRQKTRGFDDAAAAAIARQGDPEGARPKAEY
jgi:hypothetical protein